MTGYESHDTAELKRLLAEPDDYIGPPVKERIKRELASRSKEKPAPIKYPSSDQQVSEPVVVTLPWDVLVSVNERQNPHSGFTLTRKYRKGLAAARLAVEAQYHGPVLTGPVTATFEFYPPSRRPDLPNYLKLPMDAMEGIIYENDRQVNAGGGWKWMYIDKESPRCVITVQHTTDSAVEPDTAA